MRWFELIPLISFLFQQGRCNTCSFRIGIQYPLAELLSGFIFVIVPWRLLQLWPSLFLSSGDPGFLFWVFSGLWIAVFLLLVLVSYIDIRLGIIPDESHIILGVLAIGIVSILSLHAGAGNASFLGNYASVFGFQENLWASRIIGLLFGFLFFGLLVLLTRGKGMGMGDVKLSLPLGFLLGWPDMLLAVVIAFVLGALVGVGGILLKKKTMHGALPFGPFLALGVAFVFFFGGAALQWYFKLLGF